MRFLFPPALTTAPSSLLWQGPSPLPQRDAGPHRAQTLPRGGVTRHPAQDFFN